MLTRSKVRMRVAAWEQHVQGSCGRMEHAALKASASGQW